MKSKQMEISIQIGETTEEMYGDIKSIQDYHLYKAVTLGLNLDIEQKDMIEDMLFHNESELYNYFENFIKIAKKIAKKEII